jgi:TRAP-type C4-dicarboxylate transport system permease small subunit
MMLPSISDRGTNMLGRIRKFLDGLYRLSGYLGAFCLVVILAIILLQMLLRWSGSTLPGATNYAGYFMAASSFFMLAFALNEGAHIRVTLVLSSLGKYRRYGEIWCYGVAALTATFFARFAIKTNYWSWKLHEVSQGQDATPIWIPQIVMSIGTVLLAIAIWDHLLRILFSDHTGVAGGDPLEARE